MTTLTKAQQARMAKFRGRKLINAVAIALALVAMAFGLFWLMWILI